MVPVATGGSRRPLFYVAPYLVTSLSFGSLAQALGPEQPLYVFDPQGLETDDPIHSSVEEMAAHYIAEMREVEPSGPYLIGGHCTGSFVAFEMVRQLQEAGDEVDLLILVDSAPPHVATPQRSHFARHLRARVRHYREEKRLKGAIVWWWGVLRERWITRWFGSGRRRRMAEVRARHAVAHAAYDGGRVEGNAVLVRSSEWHESDRSWHLAWSDLITGELAVEVVPGTHAGLVEVANSEALAAVIETSLSAVPPRHVRSRC